MSLIHEALKKAEQQRRLGEPPSLGTPFARAPRQRSLLPYLAVAIVGALGAGWYLSSISPSEEPATAPKTDKVAAQATARSAPTASATTPAPGETPISGADQRRPTPGSNPIANAATPAPRPDPLAQAAPNPPTVKEMAERESEPHPPGTNPLAPGEAAPLTLGAAPPETAVNAAEGLAAKQVEKEREFAAGGEPGRSPFIKERAATPPPPARPAKPATAAAAPPAGFVPPDQKAPPKPPVAEIAPAKPPAPAAVPAPAPPAPPPAAATPALEQLPAFWQLPYNVRKELPELKMSMHVYSATPTQRFVVLNGNRQVEGDELGGEVHVTEIRTDGVVLTYHGQRFLVPRGGT